MPTKHTKEHENQEIGLYSIIKQLLLCALAPLRETASVLRPWVGSLNALGSGLKPIHASREPIRASQPQPVCRFLHLGLLFLTPETQGGTPIHSGIQSVP